MGEKKRIIVCGARDYKDYRRVEDALRAERGSIELALNGLATGADTHAHSACLVLGIPREGVRANWSVEGRAAGVIRNQKMLVKLLEFPGIKEVWAFHDDLSSSKGTLDMVARSHKAGVPIRVYGKGSGWTRWEEHDRIVLCQKCGGEKLLPRLLAYRIRCEADFHRTGNAGREVITQSSPEVSAD